MIHEDFTESFGSTISSVPMGSCTVNGQVRQVKGLVVRATYPSINQGNAVNMGIPTNTGARSRVFIYKPKCIVNSNQTLSGLVSDSGEPYLGMGETSTLAVKRNEPLPVDTTGSSVVGANPAVVGSNSFGVSMLAAGDPTKQTSVGYLSTLTTKPISHLLVTDQQRMKIFVYPIFVKSNDGYNFGSYKELDAGGREINYQSTDMVFGANGDGANIGFGTTMANAGDLNSDGKIDVAVSMSLARRAEPSLPINGQGSVLMLFGGSSGLQSHTTTVIPPSRQASCYYTGSDSVCNPALVYLPQATGSIRNGSYERAFLSPYSWMDYKNWNEGLGAILIGAPGKDSMESSESERILQGGAFYVGP
jgi:hypothetical protein